MRVYVIINIQKGCQQDGEFKKIILKYQMTNADLESEALQIKSFFLCKTWLLECKNKNCLTNEKNQAVFLNRYEGNIYSFMNLLE